MGGIEEGGLKGGVVGGDEMMMEVSLEKRGGGVRGFKGVGVVDGKVVWEGRMMCGGRGEG